MNAKPFTILTVGYGQKLIDLVWNQVADHTGYSLSHILHPSIFPSDMGKLNTRASKKFYFFSERPQKNLPKADLNYLAELEEDAGPTINNLIMGDDKLSRLPYDDALDYVSMAAKRLRDILVEVEPDIGLSGYDGFQGTLFMLVCRKMHLPWFALTYTAIPPGLTGFSSYNNSQGTRSYGPVDELFFRDLALKTLSDFEAKQVSVHVPRTESSLLNILRFLPLRGKNAFLSIRRHMGGGYDRYTQRSFFEALFDYLRRRTNYLSNRRIKLRDTPISGPYVFLGVHMQPEMGIDVWAPFYSNQPHVVESIARSIPPTHRVLVKLHKIDVDNWSNRQLRRMQETLGVTLVAAEANTRDLIVGADIVFSIQGTICLEAALMGRHIISFGSTMYEDFPSVTQVENLTDLPELVRLKLGEKAPARSDIVEGLEKYLMRFRSGLYNNWDLVPKDFELDGFCNHLEHLSDFLKIHNKVEKLKQPYS